MIRYSMLLILLFLVLITKSSYADDNKEDVYLKQIYNQLDAIQPLILAAQKSQSKNQRIQFHYIKFKDDQGVLHHGLLEDIQTIKSGIKQKLDQVSVEPRTIASIKGDYQ